MKKEITLTIPQDWSSVSLKKYLRLQKELKNYSESEEAMTAVMLQELCGLDASYLNSISVNDYTMLRVELGKFISKTDCPLERIVEWNGKRYGFEPNLSQMAYGAYLDIAKFDSLTIDENWAKVMNILYREVTTQKGDMYETKPYDTSVDNTSEILQWGMNVHFGALFFFLHLSADLARSIPNFSKEVDKHPHLLQILRKSGEVTKRLLNFQEEI